MKTQSNKMADLHFVDFALIPSPVRKEKYFRLPLPWVPEVFLVRFPVSVMSLLQCQRPSAAISVCRARENPLVPRVGYLTTFPNLILLSAHRRAIPRSVFPRFFEFSHHGQTAVRRSAKWFYTTGTRAKQEISTFPLSEVEIVTS